MSGDEKCFQNAFIEGLQENGWIHSSSESALDYDPELAIIPSDLKQWAITGQSTQWRRLVHKAGNENKALNRLVAEVVRFRKAAQSKGGGTYNLLLHGLEVDTVKFELFKNRPSEAFSFPDEVEMYDDMVFRVVSDFHYSSMTPSNTISLGFFINGIPVGTAELDSSFTKSVSKVEKQYLEDHIPGPDMILDPSAGAMFHFAVTPDKASLTSLLCGDKTRFIPFNTGINNRQFALENEGQFPTSYLWKEVLTKDYLVLIIFAMMRNIESDGVSHTRFPRYHQLDNLKQITASVKLGRTRRNYLSQHAPGSGKSDEIANLAYALSTLLDEGGAFMYSSIIIITNRTVLDNQIRDLFLSKIKSGGYFHPIARGRHGSKSVELAEKLLSKYPPRIISVTAQTFTDTLVDTMRKEAARGRKISGSYAIIIDEAHDGEIGKQHEKMYEALLGDSFNINGSATGDPDKESSDAPNLTGESLGGEVLTNLRTLNFFAYTATPHADVLRVFGEEKIDENGDVTYEPFHTYSMQQAREEGYINDVLANYVTYDRRVRIGLNPTHSQGDEIVDFMKGRKEIKKWVNTAPEIKEVIVENIIQKMQDIVIPSLGGEGKAMLTCFSRNDALAYKRLIDAAIDKLPEEERFGTLVAYSGKLTDSVTNEEVSELDPQVNRGIGKRKDLAEVFKGKKFRLLIVANKFQVGFDQPKLVCMFIDKPLNDINLIQTTARVNRKIPGKDNVYIFDFANKKDQIIDTFKKFDEDATAALSFDLSTATLDEILQKTVGFDVHTDDDLATVSDAYEIADNLNSTTDEVQSAGAQVTNTAEVCSNRFYALFGSQLTESISDGAEYKALLRKYTTIYSLLSITRDDIQDMNEIGFTYGKQSRFFELLLEMIREGKAVSEFPVDLNALNLEHIAITPLAPIGGVLDGDSEVDELDYSSAISLPDFSPNLGPLAALIEQINALLEGDDISSIETHKLFEAFISDAQADKVLMGLARDKDEQAFIDSRRVRNIISRLLSRQLRHDDLNVSEAAKIVMSMLDADTNVIANIAQMLYEVFLLASPLTL
jgi:type I restriction enzyme R subunit